MLPDIELYKSDEQLGIITENLEFFGELLPKDSVLEVNLKDYGGRADFSKQYIESGLKEALFLPGRADFSKQYIESGLKEALFLPGRANLDIENMSVILFDKRGEKGLFLTNRLPSKQNRMGLPGFLEIPGRAFYGVIWGKETPRVFSSFGNPLFREESHPMSKSDVCAIDSLCHVISDFSLVTEKDKESGEANYSLIGVRKVERYSRPVL